MHALVNVASHPTKLSGKAGRFDQISIALHWLTVLLVFAQFATAWLLVEGGDGARIVLAVHRAIGAVIWIVVALRLFWRCSFAYLPAFTASMPKLQQRVAKLSEYGLYGLLLVQPLTGLGNTLLRGRPFTIGAWQVPALFAPDRAFAQVFELLHELGAWALLALIGLHAVALPHAYSARRRVAANAALDGALTRHN